MQIISNLEKRQLEEWGGEGDWWGLMGRGGVNGGMVDQKKKILQPENVLVTINCWKQITVSHMGVYFKYLSCSVALIL